MIDESQRDLFERLAALSIHTCCLQELAFADQIVTGSRSNRISLRWVPCIMQGSVKMLIRQHNLPDISVFVIDHNLEDILGGEQPERVFLVICNKTEGALP